MDRTARLRKGTKTLRNTIWAQMRRTFSFGDVHTRGWMEEMHLRTDHIYACAVGDKVFRLFEERSHVVFIDIKQCRLRKVFLTPHKRLERIIGGHRTVMALVERLAAHGLASKAIEVSRAFVHHVPRINAASIAFRDQTDATLVKLLKCLDICWDKSSDLILRKLFVNFLPGWGPPYFAGIVLVILRTDRLGDIATGNRNSRRTLERNLLGLWAEILPQPCRSVPRVIAPYERMAVDSYAARSQKTNHRIDCGTPPMRLLLGMRAVVPEILGIFVAFLKAGRVRIHFKRTPVERDCCRIEECSVKLLVAVIPLLLAKLIEIKNMCTKEERMCLLTYRHNRTIWRIDFHCGICLAELFDVGINLRLHIIIPNLPIGIRHHRLVDIEISSR